MVGGIKYSSVLLFHKLLFRIQDLNESATSGIFMLFYAPVFHVFLITASNPASFQFAKCGICVAQLQRRPSCVHFYIGKALEFPIQAPYHGRLRDVGIVERYPLWSCCLVREWERRYRQATDTVLRHIICLLLSSLSIECLPIVSMSVINIISSIKMTQMSILNRREVLGQDSHSVKRSET